MREDITELLDSELERSSKRPRSEDKKNKKSNIKEGILNALYLEADIENFPSRWKINKLLPGNYDEKKIDRAIGTLKILGFLWADKDDYIYPCLGDNFVEKSLKNNDLFKLYKAVKGFENSKDCFKDNDFKESFGRIIIKINEEFSRPNTGPVKLLCFKFAVFWVLMVKYQRNSFTREEMTEMFTPQVKAILERNNYNFLQKNSPLQDHGFVSVADVRDPVTNEEFYSICTGEEFEKKLICYLIKPTDPEILWENYTKAYARMKERSTSTSFERLFPEREMLLSKTEEQETYLSNPYLLKPFILKPKNLSPRAPKKSLPFSIQFILTGGINSSKITSLAVGAIPGEEEENANSEEERSESGPTI